MRRGLVTLTLVLLVACGGAQQDAKETQKNEPTATPTPSETPTIVETAPAETEPADEDADKYEVVVDTCKKEGLEVIASGTIKNNSSRTRGYAVHIEFYDKSGARIEEGTDFVFGVEPGQVARWRQDNFTKSDYTLGECKVAGVTAS